MKKINDQEINKLHQMNVAEDLNELMKKYRANQMMKWNDKVPLHINAVKNINIRDFNIRSVKNKYTFEQIYNKMESKDDKYYFTLMFNFIYRDNFEKMDYSNCHYIIHDLFNFDISALDNIFSFIFTMKDKFINTIESLDNKINTGGDNKEYEMVSLIRLMTYIEKSIVLVYSFKANNMLQGALFKRMCKIDHEIFFSLQIIEITKILVDLKLLNIESTIDLFILMEQDQKATFDLLNSILTFTEEMLKINHTLNKKIYNDKVVNKQIHEKFKEITGYSIADYCRYSPL